MKEFDYDVFLSHNSKDKPAVEHLAEKLEDEAGVRVFLDKWNLVPGDPWQEELENALERSRTIAVFLGPSGIGSWHNEEMRSALELRVRNKRRRVIPVLLPGITLPQDNQMPVFLSRLIWVDFRGGLDDSDAFDRLLAGINGTAPGRSKLEKATEAPLSKENISAQVFLSTPKGLTSELYKRVREIFLICEYFESDKQLRAIFAHPDIHPWQIGLPQAGNTEERVDLLINYLSNQRHRDGRNMLVAFIDILVDRYDVANNLHHQIAEIADKIR